MKLDILVPQYKEDETIVKPLLDSIAFQQNINFDDIGVIIVNDGTDVLLSKEFLDSYPYKITYIHAEHGGVSATRGKAFDASTADYVMFCDADDMFFNMCGLWIIFREMQGEGFDALNSTFLEDSRMPVEEGGQPQPIFINREQDATFVHGKIYRRQYLLDNNIRWNPALTIHEDSFFNCLALNCTQKVKYCPTPFYLWKWRDDSVCRRDFKYILKTYNNLLDSNTALVEQLLARDKKDPAAFYAASMVYDAYFTMNKDEWINQENKEYRDATERRFAKYYKKFKDLAMGIHPQLKANILQRIRSRFYFEGMFFESITFDKWIEGIEKLIEEDN